MVIMVSISYQKSELALTFQDLKEQAKHEALRVLAELRRALLALGQLSGLEDLIFQLSMEEIQDSDWSAPRALKRRAVARKASRLLNGLAMSPPLIARIASDPRS